MIDLKFLIFNSYTTNTFKIINKYIGYFPLNFYYSVFDFNFASILRFSPIAFDLNNYKSKYFRKRNNYNFDVDLHISLFLGRGVIRLKVIGLINFYRYLVQDIILFMG